MFIAAVAALRAKGKLSRAWLFGSYAWGQPTAASDLDVMVEGTDDPFALAAEIGAAVKLDVHVVERKKRRTLPHRASGCRGH